MENPWSLLMFASTQVEASKPDPLAKWRSQQQESLDFEYLLQKFIDDPNPASAFVVALFVELFDDEELQQRYRDALDSHSGPLPRWLTGLKNVDVFKAARISHVLGDFDRLFLGARLVDGREATVEVMIKHFDDSQITDAILLPATIDDALDELSDPDLTVVDMSLADARAWIEPALRRSFVIRDTATWPGCRPLLQWLVSRLPDGGESYEWPAWDPGATKELLDEFFASEDGSAFNRWDHHGVMQDLAESGTGDPLRWSAARVEHVLDSSDVVRDHSVKLALQIPSLLRAFIVFAHKRSGVREGLTAEALAVLDGMTLSLRSAG